MAENTKIEWTETGRSVASNGYVLIRVGKAHLLADVRGYAYEHRLVASREIGRWVLPSEHVHHKNEVKTDNRPENLEVVAGTSEHRVRHRKAGTKRRMPGEPNEAISCACGCGQTFGKYDDSGRPRSYVSGHNPHPLGELSEMVLWYLANVSEPTNSLFISSFFGIAREQVTATLSRLKAKGLVVNHGRDWSCCG